MKTKSVNYTILENPETHWYWAELEKLHLATSKAILNAIGMSFREELIRGLDEESKQNYLNQMQKLDQLVIQTGETLTLEETFFTQTQDICVLLTSKEPLKDEKGENIGLISTSVDITATKKAHQNELKKWAEKLNITTKALEEERVLKEAVSIYAGSIAHHLQIPINSIVQLNEFNISCIHKLEEFYVHTNEFSRMKSYFTKIKKSQGDIFKITQNMSASIAETTEKIENVITGREVKLKILSAKRVLNQVMNYYATDIDQGLIHIGEIAHFFFHGNEVSFYRIIMNLVQNAKRQIKIKNRGNLFFYTTETEKYHVLNIKDTAGGVTLDLVNRLFDLHKTRQVHGTGIGLQFCQLEMQKINGSLTAHLSEDDFILLQLNFPKI
jgi:signal transduction histidine kinase